MSKDEKKKKEKDKKEYTYYHVLDEQNATALAIRKITTLYIPDIAEMTKLTALSLERKRVQEAYTANMDKIIKGINELHPLPEKDEEEETDKKAIAAAAAELVLIKKIRDELLNKKSMDLLNQDCGFSFEKVTLDISAIEEALKMEVTKTPREIKVICPECKALVKTIDPERNIMSSKTFADLIDFVELKELR